MSNFKDTGVSIPGWDENISVKACGVCRLFKQQKAGRFYVIFLSFSHCAPGGARFQRVQVSNPPGSGKDIAEGKGVHREVESEGSRIWGKY